MNRTQAIPFVSFVVDDSGNGRVLNEDQHAIVREQAVGYQDGKPILIGGQFAYPSVLVGWQCGFEPLFVAVHSYLDVELDDDEAEEIATEYLIERGWFEEDPHKSIITASRPADYIIR